MSSCRSPKPYRLAGKPFISSVSKMRSSFLLLMVAMAILGEGLGFQLSTRSSLVVSRSPSTLAAIRRTTARKRSLQVAMQLGGEGGGPIERGTMPTYEEEKGGEQEFFKTDLDKRPDAEKVKDPIVIITLGWILGMFLVATAFIVGGVN